MLVRPLAHTYEEASIISETGISIRIAVVVARFSGRWLVAYVGSHCTTFHAAEWTAQCVNCIALHSWQAAPPSSRTVQQVLPVRSMADCLHSIVLARSCSLCPVTRRCGPRADLCAPPSPRPMFRPLSRILVVPYSIEGHTNIGCYIIIIIILYYIIGCYIMFKYIIV
jgi:hypothetical protein